MNIVLIFVVLLVCASIFVNGWTDCPNAIATVISTRVLSPKKAVLLGVFFNFLGVLVMGTAVASTVANFVDVGSGKDALVTLGAAQVSIVIWAVSAWKYGIPTSESHALFAGLAGAAVSHQKDISAINQTELMRLLIGLVVATLIGFIVSFIFTKIIEVLFRNVKRRSANKFFSIGQIFSASLMALSHGAQDGQKFMGMLYQVLLVGGVIVKSGNDFVIPIEIMILCAVLMGLGTYIGGYRIIKTMGIDMVQLDKYQGFSAEMAASSIMIISTLNKIPLSTTNTKGTAMMGAGASRGIKKVNWLIAKDMVLAWVLTFPACFILGYVFSSLFRLIF